MTRPVTVLFVAGFGRNGGTLLDRVLGSVDGFCSLGEFRFVWQKGVVRNELCNCGVPFRDCPFWTAVFSANQYWRRSRCARFLTGSPFCVTMIG